MVCDTHHHWVHYGTGCTVLSKLAGTHAHLLTTCKETKHFSEHVLFPYGQLSVQYQVPCVVTIQISTTACK